MTLSKWPETDVMFVFSMRRFGIEHFLKKYSYFTNTIIPEIRAAHQTKASVFFLNALWNSVCSQCLTIYYSCIHNSFQIVNALSSISKQLSGGARWYKTKEVVKAPKRCHGDSPYLNSNLGGKKLKFSSLFLVTINNTFSFCAGTRFHWRYFCWFIW